MQFHNCLSSTRSQLFYEIVTKYIKSHGCRNTYCWNCTIFTFMLDLMIVNDKSNLILNCSDDIFKFPAIITDNKTKKELNHPFSELKMNEQRNRLPTITRNSEESFKTSVE